MKKCRRLTAIIISLLMTANLSFSAIPAFGENSEKESDMRTETNLEKWIEPEAAAAPEEEAEATEEPVIDEEELEEQINNEILQRSAQVEQESGQAQRKAETRANSASLQSVDKIMQDYMPSVNESPFMMATAENETISLNSGNLSYTYNIASFPGRNGLDLNLRLNYDFSQSFKMGFYSDDAYEYPGPAVTINNHQIANGWSWGFDSISNIDLIKYQTVANILNLSNGGSHVFQDIYFERYEYDDLKLEKDPGTGNIVLIKKDGTREYFDGTNLIKIEDRFGNTIEFTYQKANNLDYLDTITDSVGRVIKFEYSTDYKTITIKLGDNEIISTIYLSGNASMGRYKTANKPRLEKIIDAEGNVTSFAHEELKIPAEEYSQYDYSYDALTKVTYPTGGNVKYEYMQTLGSLDKVLGSNYYYERYQTDGSCRYVLKNKTTSDGKIVSYNYFYNNTGYPLYRQDRVGDIAAGSDESYQYYTVVQEKGGALDKKMIYTFNEKHEKTAERILTEGTDFISLDNKKETSLRVHTANKIYDIKGKTVKSTDVETGAVETVTYELSDGTAMSGTLSMEDAQYTVTMSAIRVLLKGSNGRRLLYEYDLIAHTIEQEAEMELGANVKTNLVRNNSADYLFVNRANKTEVYRLNGDEWVKDGEIGGKTGLTAYYSYGDKICLLNSGGLVEYNTNTHTFAFIGVSLSGGAPAGVFRDENTGEYLIYSGYVYKVDIENKTAVRTTELVGDCIPFRGLDKKIYRLYQDRVTLDGTVVYKRKIPSLNTKKVQGVLTTMGGVYMQLDENFYSYERFPIGDAEGTGEIVEGVTEYTYNNYSQPETSASYMLDNSDPGNPAELEETKTTQEFLYDMKNNLLEYTDSYGYKTKTEYDERYSLPVKIYAYYGTENQETTAYTLDESKRRADKTIQIYKDGSQLISEVTYEGDYPGNVKTTKITSKNGETEKVESETEYGYDPTHSLVTETKQKNVKTRKSGADGSIAEETKEISDYASYDQRGRQISATDAEGNTVNYEYDGMGRVTRTTQPSGAYETRSYQMKNADEAGANEMHVTVTDPSYDTSYMVVNTYDELGRLVQSEKSVPGSGTKTLKEVTYGWKDGLIISEIVDGNMVEYAYDGSGRIKKVTDKIFGMTSYDEKRVEIEYMDNAMKARVRDGGRKVEYTYDKYGRTAYEKHWMNEDAESITGYTYNYKNQVEKTTDAYGRESQNFYDARGNAVKVRNALGQETAYTYDMMGNLLKVRMPDESEIKMEYDSLGRLVEREDQLGNREYCVYDDLGRITKQIDRNGTAFSYTYQWNQESPAEKTAGGEEVSWTYDGMGQVREMEDSGGRTEYEYYSDGLLKRVKTPDNKKLEYTSYTAGGRLLGMKDYYGNQYQYSYDTASRLEEVRLNGELEASYTYKHDGSGQLIKTAYRDGTEMRYEYYGSGGLKGITHEVGGTVVNTYGYTYDLMGNKVTESHNGKTASYIYDELYRLKETTDEQGTRTEYTFDEGGNISEKRMTHPEGYVYTYDEAEIGNVTEHKVTYSYDGANKLTEAVETVEGGGTLSRTDSYAYDRNGNNLMKVSGYITDKKEGEEETGISESSPYVTMYEYDSFGRLSKAETGGKKAEYSYDGNGVRRSKTVEGKTTGYYMAGDQVINETENGSLSASNIIAGGIIGRITGGTSYMMLKNDHGDVVGLTANGEVKADYTYSAYGELIADGSNGINNPIRYAGEYTDEESGLIYLRARYYDPGLGRFISEDPIRDGMNWYAYCYNNPVMFIDPSGMEVYFGTKEEADYVLQNIAVLTGYNGYDVTLQDNGMYMLIDTGKGEINGGSDLARSMIKAAMEMDSIVNIVVNANVAVASVEVYSNGIALRPEDIDPQATYENRTSVLTLNTQNDQNALLTFMHELAHSLSWGLEHYNKLIFSNEVVDKSDVLIKYMEATAITLYNAISKELNWGLVDSYTRDGYYVNGVYELYMNGPRLYGAFPFEYTNGEAAIISSLGPNIAEYYKINYGGGI